MLEIIRNILVQVTYFHIFFNYSLYGIELIYELIMKHYVKEIHISVEEPIKKQKETL